LLLKDAGSVSIQFPLCHLCHLSVEAPVSPRLVVLCHLARRNAEPLVPPCATSPRNQACGVDGLFCATSPAGAQERLCHPCATSPCNPPCGLHCFFCATPLPALSRGARGTVCVCVCVCIGAGQCACVCAAARRCGAGWVNVAAAGKRLRIPPRSERRARAARERFIYPGERLLSRPLQPWKQRKDTPPSPKQCHYGGNFSDKTKHRKS
jgi:hypothetical protein